MPDPKLTLLPFCDELAHDFYAINAEWITQMYDLEDHDRYVLENPQATIIDKGGVILFVKSRQLGIIGTCALKPDATGWIELTKMGVLNAARGQKAGEFLLRAAIDHAHKSGWAERLYLLTNRKSQAAIHLYRKNGFVEDGEIMDRFGPQYHRCDVAMRYHSP